MADANAAAPVKQPSQDEESANFHIARAQQLRTNRGIFDEHCEEVASVVMPAHRQTFLGWNWTTPYAKKTDRQWDASATVRVQRFAAVLESLLTPPGSIWHRLAPADKHLKTNRAVRQYLEQVNDRLMQRRNRPDANFVGQIQSVYLSLGLYGNGILMLDSMDDGSGVRYKYLHLGQVYFCENHQGQVDTFYRFFKLTPRQAKQQFKNWTPKGIMAQANQPGSSEELYEFLHCVYPREDYDPRRVDYMGMKFASIYFAVESREKVAEGGYRRFPAAISRYMQAPSEVYGRGPSMLVLPQIKLLNEEQKSIIRQGHRALEPIILAADDGVIGTFSLRPNAVNYGTINDQGQKLVDVLPAGNVMVGEKLIAQNMEVLDDIYFMKIFKMLEDNPQMTATQVVEIAREKGFLIGPTVGRQTSELLGPLIAREVDLAEQQGDLPPMPPQLAEAGGKFTIEYDNPMSRMQRAENASGFMHYVDQLSQYAKDTGDTEALDWVQFDNAAPQLADILGVPIDWVPTLAQVMEKRKNRQQQQLQQQLVENAAGLGSAVGAVGKMGKGK